MMLSIMLRNFHLILPVTAENTGKIAQIHMMIEDSTGDAAILEYINGKLQVYHGRK
jgi:penicillin V acylase-like amidase (Ntn superfamily)